MVDGGGASSASARSMSRSTPGWSDANSAPSSLVRAILRRASVVAVATRSRRSTAAASSSRRVLASTRWGESTGRPTSCAASRTVRENDVVAASRPKVTAATAHAATTIENGRRRWRVVASARDAPGTSPRRSHDASPSGPSLAAARSDRAERSLKPEQQLVVVHDPPPSRRASRLRRRPRARDWPAHGTGSLAEDRGDVVRGQPRHHAQLEQLAITVRELVELGAEAACSSHVSTSSRPGAGWVRDQLSRSAPVA